MSIQSFTQPDGHSSLYTFPIVPALLSVGFGLSGCGPSPGNNARPTSLDVSVSSVGIYSNDLYGSKTLIVGDVVPAAHPGSLQIKTITITSGTSTYTPTWTSTASGKQLIMYGFNYAYTSSQPIATFSSVTTTGCQIDIFPTTTNATLWLAIIDAPGLP